MKLKSTLLLIAIMVLIVSCKLFSQTKEIDCLKEFNSIVKQELINLSNNEINVTSDSIKLIFELYVLESGEIDSICVKKSNLDNFGISDTLLASKIIGKTFVCMRDVYYKVELPPDKVIIVYNTNILGKND